MKAQLYTCLLLYGLVMYGCGSKETITPDPFPADSLGRINRWILDSMRRYYYWADGITAQPDYAVSSNLFFKSLLSSDDRFSWISNGTDIKAPSNSYFTYGFHYAWVQVTGMDSYLGVITVTNKNGAADRAGFRRGTYFSKLNGVPVTTVNMAAANSTLTSGARLLLTPVVYDNGWKEQADITLAAGFTAEIPLLYTRTYTAGGVTTGYLYYNSFNENYDAELLTAFGKLKAANVSELILDLRYNGGGSVASSAKLAAMIAGKLTGGNTYVIYQGNSREGRKSRTLQQVLNTSASNAGKQYATLQDKLLPLQRVFILTTKATVSAAELVTNNLKPYIQVNSIGETTAGKNEAGFLISDYRVPKQVWWQMEPTIYKLFNSANIGNYEGGLTPQYKIDELAQLPLADIGSPDDILVKKALELIYGNTLPDHYSSLRTPVTPALQVTPVFRSAEDPVLQNPMIVNPVK